MDLGQTSKLAIRVFLQVGQEHCRVIAVRLIEFQKASSMLGFGLRGWVVLVEPRRACAKAAKEPFGYRSK